MPKLAVPSKFDKFEILELIALGLTGEIYKARHQDGTIVALKVCTKEHDRTIFGYFTNEPMLLREVALHRRHPNIVEYFTSNLNRSPYYLATRFVEGARPLEALLGNPMLKGNPQPAAFVVRVITQIASALDYLHAGHPTFSPIVHRDVKPANILIDDAGNAVLIDLSVAIHPHYVLQDEQGLGTPSYMAPEQYKGEEIPATDQFGLAMVALHMLTGRRVLPERGNVAYKRLEQWRDTQYEEITKLLGTHVHTADVLVRALAYDPANRYESCEIFADRLRRALIQDGESVQETTQRAGMFISPKPKPTGMLSWIAMAIVAIVAIAVLILALTSTTNPPEPPTATSVIRIASTTTLGPSASITTVVPFSTLVTTAQQSTLVSPPAFGIVKIINQTEPLRSQPSTDAVVLTRMPVGGQAERTGNEQPTSAFIWYEVRFQNQIGWCRSLYCQPS
jgi:serine/threonine protein kinase